MASVEIKIAPLNIRRFEIPDLDRHGQWVLPRLLTAYSHLNDRSAIGWLRSVIYNNEFLFLFADHAVGLAQVMSAHTLAPKPVVNERFVWVQDPNNAQHLADAAQFYTHFHVWAQHLGAEVMIVEEMTDVPHEMVREKVGRIYNRQQQFARV